MREIVRHSIGREKAVALFDSGWWKGKPAMEVALRQMFTAELCMDFGDFQAAVEEALGRPVWTHEFASDDLARELLGEKQAPSMQEMLDLIPEEKRVIVVVSP